LLKRDLRARRAPADDDAGIDRTRESGHGWPIGNDTMIRKLHHSAYRCRDSGETRRFYEDLLGLPLACALEIHETKTGRRTRVLHTFFRLGDGSFLAFFEAPDQPFEFKAQHDFDLHIALEVDAGVLPAMRRRAMEAGIEVRGVSDHGFVRSIYLRDPNGYVVELCTRQPDGADAMDPQLNDARGVLERWLRAKEADGLAFSRAGWNEAATGG
jgi:catechol 2,3-dioxygenase-like lactoylglutathione lyase family enzyme